MVYCVNVVLRQGSVVLRQGSGSLSIVVRQGSGSALC